MSTHKPPPQLRGYKLESQIGSGSSGTVYLGYQEKSGKEVVVKLVTLSNLWLRKEYEREVTNLSKINYPGTRYIVRIIEYFEFRNYGVIVLERLQQDLLDFIESCKPTLQQVKDIFIQVCRGVNFIHEYGLAHLDIKPENIFLNSTNDVKLGDFGTSVPYKEGKSIIRFGQLGTRFYCAPEVRPNIAFYPDKADIWSLGILLYVLLTGYWPFSATTQEKLQQNIDKGITKFLMDALPTDASLIELLKQMLSICPSDRPKISEVLQNPWLRSDSGFIVSDSESGQDQDDILSNDDSIESEQSPRFPKSSSTPDMCDMLSCVPDAKSPRNRRASLKEDEEEDRVVLSVCAKKKKKKNKSRRFSGLVHSLLSKFNKI